MHHSRLFLIFVALMSFPGAVAADHPSAEQLVLATYKLANQGSTASGIAFQFEKDDGSSQIVMVSASHVFQQMHGDWCTVVSRTRLEDDTFRREELQVAIRDNGRPLWNSHPQHDVAVLPLPATIECNSLPIDCLATTDHLASVHTGDSVHLAVYPERSEANSSGFAILRKGSIASFPFAPATRYPIFLVDTTSWTGDSGGPVSHAKMQSPSGGPVVLGIVHGMRNIADTVKESRFVERRTNYPLGISEMTHITFARELIEDLK